MGQLITISQHTSNSLCKTYVNAVNVGDLTVHVLFGLGDTLKDLAKIPEKVGSSPSITGKPFGVALEFQ